MSQSHSDPGQPMREHSGDPLDVRQEGDPVAGNTWRRIYSGILNNRLTALGYHETVRPETQLVACGIDSLATVSLVLELEAALGVEIPEHLMIVENFRTFGAMEHTYAQVLSLRDDLP